MFFEIGGLGDFAVVEYVLLDGITDGAVRPMDDRQLATQLLQDTGFLGVLGASSQKLDYIV